MNSVPLADRVLRPGTPALAISISWLRTTNSSSSFRPGEDVSWNS